MTEDEIQSQAPKKGTGSIKVLAIAVIIILVGAILYVVFIGFGSGGRDDNVSLNDIEQKSKENTVVMYFWSDGCGYCTEQKPIIRDLENDYKKSNVTFYWFNANNHEDLTNEYNINGVPATIVLNQNGVVKKFVGLVDYSDIAKIIDQSILTYE